jgi:hypothetical protein
MYQCPVEYEPEKQYTRREMIEMIKAQRQQLCFFAQESGYRRCVLGMEFERYDEVSKMVPVYVLGETEAKLVERVEGKKFKRAYRSSQVGQAIMITFTSPSGRGWFKLRWELGTPKEGHTVRSK